jgi:hypothetical protein
MLLDRGIALQRGHSIISTTYMADMIGRSHTSRTCGRCPLRLLWFLAHRLRNVLRSSAFYVPMANSGMVAAAPFALTGLWANRQMESTQLNGAVASLPFSLSPCFVNLILIGSCTSIFCSVGKYRNGTMSSWETCPLGTETSSDRSRWFVIVTTMASAPCR